MKVSSDIKILKGAKRFALYNLNHKFVEPISDLQAKIIQMLASGKRPKNSDFDVSSKEFWTAIGGLKKLDAFCAGYPTKTEINFISPKNDFELKGFDQVWLEITNSCNLSCSHCYSNSSPKVDRSDELELESWKKIIEKILLRGVSLITLIGGEPLVRHELIKELIPFIKDQHPEVQVNIFTNLTILPRNPEFINLLKTYSVRVGTSLYGVESSGHDLMTNKKGSWLKTISNIKRLADSKIDIFAGYYRSSNCKLDKLQIESFIEGLGVLDYEILTPSQVGRGSDTEWRVINLENTLPSRKYFDYSSPYKNMQTHNCFADRFSINQKGEVLPCIMKRDVSYGNILESDLSLVLSSIEYKKHSSLSKDKIDGCKDCEFKYGCFDCRPDAQNGDDNLFRKPDCGYSPYDEI